MTYQGAIDELKSLENNESMPDWFKPTIKKVRETIEMDGREKVSGEWICYTEEFYQQGRFADVHHRIRECSFCHHKIADFVGNMNFCPSCGADMKGRNRMSDYISKMNTEKDDGFDKGYEDLYLEKFKLYLGSCSRYMMNQCLKEEPYHG